MSKWKIGSILFWVGWIMIVLLIVIKAMSLLGTYVGCVLIALAIMIIGGFLYINED